MPSQPWLRGVILFSFALQTVVWLWGTILDFRAREKAKAGRGKLQKSD